jgi:hypothetical protein
MCCAGLRWRISALALSYCRLDWSVENPVPPRNKRRASCSIYYLVGRKPANRGGKGGKAMTAVASLEKIASEVHDIEDKLRTVVDHLREAEKEWKETRSLPYSVVSHVESEETHPPAESAGP